MVPHYFRRGAFSWQWRRIAAAFSNLKRNMRGEAPHAYASLLNAYFSASSVTSCVQAPSGSLEMTGSEPPASSDSTVRL